MKKSICIIFLIQYWKIKKKFRQKMIKNKTNKVIVKKSKEKKYINIYKILKIVFI